MRMPDTSRAPFEKYYFGKQLFLQVDLVFICIYFLIYTFSLKSRLEGQRLDIRCTGAVQLPCIIFGTIAVHVNDNVVI